MRKVLTGLLLVSLFISACALSGQSATPTPEVSSDIAQEESSQPEPTQEPQITPTMDPVEISHEMVPAAFVLAPLQRIFDCTTGDKKSDYSFGDNCDDWEYNRFERPTSAENAAYFPEVDIVQGEFGEDEKWIYARIFLFSEGIEELVLDGIYAVEIDLDLDSRGEFMIKSISPADNPPGEWTVVGVEVWLDENDDVGGQQAMQVDSDHEGDGYETLLFDSGSGSDPDLAWVKVSQEKPGILDIAFKRDLLQGDTVFSWWMWSMQEELGPNRYEPVDFYEYDTVHIIDNTCSWIFGSAPQDLPNSCSAITPPKPTNQPGNPGDSCSPPPGGCEAWEYWSETICSCQIFN